MIPPKDHILRETNPQNTEIWNLPDKIAILRELNEVETKRKDNPTKIRNTINFKNEKFKK